MTSIRTSLSKKKGGDPNLISLVSQGFVLSEVKEWIPSGLNELDYVIGGGLPVGRTIEIFGPEGVGKSAYVHRAIKGCQDAGGIAVLSDHEIALDVRKVKQQNIDEDRLVYLPPDYLEQGLDVWHALMDKFIEVPPGGPILFALDSIAGAPAKAEFSADSADDATVAAQARAMGKFFRTITTRLPKCRACAIFVNQERDAIGGFSPNPMMKPKLTPGGGAAKYFASLRMRNTKISTLKEGTTSTGYVIRTETKKARVVPPHRRAEWILDFTYGPSPALTTLWSLVQGKKAKLAGGEYTLPWTAERFNRHTFVQAYAEPDFRKAAVEVSLALVEARQTNAPDEMSGPDE